MKKFLSIILIFSLFFVNSIPVFAAEKIKKPSVGTFNKAVKNGDIDKVQAYLNAGFNPNKKHWKTWFLYGTPIIGTAINTKQDKMLDLLLENGASPNPKSIVSPLQAAVICDNPYAVKKLLDYGANQNYKFMKQTAEQLAISKGNNEIISIFSTYKTDLYEAAELLNNPITENFYNIIKGQNPKNKPFVLRYADLKKDDLFSNTYILDDCIIVLVNNTFANCSKEALATLLAGASISTDENFSINEAAYAMMLSGAVWANFIQKNASLRNNKTLLEQNFTAYADYITEANYSLNDFKSLVKQIPTYKKMNLKEESLGYTNEILQLPKDKTKIVKATENVKKYWQENDMTDKLINASVFIICTSALVAMAIWAGNNYYTPPSVPSVVPTGTYVPTVQYVPTGTIQQRNLSTGQMLNKVHTYRPVVVPTLRY